MKKDKKEFLRRIEDVLSRIPDRPKSWKITNKGKDIKIEKVFEIYILSLICEVFREQGYAVEHHLKDRKATSNDDFIVRKAPGKLTGNAKFSYLLVKKADREYDLQISIEVFGLSGIEHEIDVGVFYHNDSELVRKGKNSCINYSSVPISIECKYYKKTSQKKNIGREFLGMAIDLERNIERLGILATRKEDKNAYTLLGYHNLTHVENFTHTKRKEFKEIIRKFVINYL